MKATWNILNPGKRQYISSWDFGEKGEFVNFAKFEASMLHTKFALRTLGGVLYGYDSLPLTFRVRGTWKDDRIRLCMSEEEGDDFYDGNWDNISTEVFMDMIKIQKHFIGGLRETTFDYKNSTLRQMPILVELAVAHKSYQYSTNDFPKLADDAMTVFREMYPDDTDYYKGINGLVKHNSHLVYLSDLHAKEKLASFSVEERQLKDKVTSLETQLSKLNKELLNLKKGI